MDPDPDLDSDPLYPYVFEPPASRSIIICRDSDNLDSTVLSLKNNVNVPFGILKATDKKSRRIRIHNTGYIMS